MVKRMPHINPTATSITSVSTENLWNKSKSPRIQKNVKIYNSFHTFADAHQDYTGMKIIAIGLNLLDARFVIPKLPVKLFTQHLLRISLPKNRV